MFVTEEMKADLLKLPTTIKELEVELEQLHHKIKMKELKLERKKSSSLLELRNAKELMKMTNDILNAKLAAKFYRKELNLQKLRHIYRTKSIELEYLQNTFSGLKKIILLEAGHGQIN